MIQTKDPMVEDVIEQIDKRISDLENRSDTLIHNALGVGGVKTRTDSLVVID